jgi:class 3 adenylate cyclase
LPAICIYDDGPTKPRGLELSKTQTVTVLFTDMVGSTELSSRLSPEAADQVRQRHFALLRQALAASEGTEVKNLGDGLMATFSSTSAAASGAVAMQQAVEQENRRSPNPLGLRVGLSGGDVTIEDSDFFGDPVVEAARLCALCDGGQILTTDTVRVMAGRRSQHFFLDIGERELKGFPEPVTVCEVVWEPAAGISGTPLPDRLETPDTELFGFFGRAAEKERLITAVKHAAEGLRQAAFLAGEPGIGKTSLCRQIAKDAHKLGVCVLYGRCNEDLSVVYQPFADALTHLVVHAGEPLLHQHVSDTEGALAAVVPALGKRMPGVSQASAPGSDPETERLATFDAVVSLLSLASSETGLLLVLDDIHWADKPTLQLLRHVVASTQLTHVMVLGAYRDSELSAGDPLTDTLASLRREADAARIELPGLEEFEILEMMEHIAGHAMDEGGWDLAHAVRKETDGNPFFTTELLRHLGDSGMIHQDKDGRWVASSDLYEKGLPGSVREVVGQRVDRLGPEMRRVLSQAAVIGQEFDLQLLAVVAEVDEDRLLDLVDEATEAGLLMEVEGAVERFKFAHALTQHTLYEDLGATRRARAHRKIAEAMTEMYGDSADRAGELARHFVDATMNFPRFQRTALGSEIPRPVGVS